MARPGLHSRNIRSGNTREYYAQVPSSGLGLFSPVPRQADIGLDYHYALSGSVGRLEAFTSPFLVSVESLPKRKIAVEPTETDIEGYIPILTDRKSEALEADRECVS